jgi:hypothetical protein
MTPRVREAFRYYVRAAGPRALALFDAIVAARPIGLVTEALEAPRSQPAPSDTEGR